MQLTQIADIIGAEIKGPFGNGITSDAVVTGLGTLAEAKNNEISFLANKKYIGDLANTHANAVIISDDFLESCPVNALVVKDPYLAFAKITEYFEYENKSLQTDSYIKDNGSYISSTAQLGESCSIGENVVIGHNVVIEDQVVIGNNCNIAHGVYIGHNVKIGDNVRIHANSSIGSEGFGFAPNITQQGLKWQRIAQLGSVRIGNNVRIGANTCIDRGAIDDTIINDDVIIDNLVQIAHNVNIGASTAIAACTGIAGSTTIGRNCIIAGGVGIAGHLKITDGVTITGASVITGNINKPGSYSSGTAMMPTSEWRKAAVNFKKLAESPFRKIAKQIEQLKQ